MDDGFDGAVWFGVKTLDAADRVSAIEVGAYVIPDDAIDDAGVVHSHEGTVWNIQANLLDENTGELHDRLHTVKVSRGDLHFSSMRSDRVGSSSITDHATCDGLLKVAGRIVAKHGRKSDPRAWAVVHTIGGYVLNMPKAAAPTIFPSADEQRVWEEEHPDEAAGFRLKPQYVEHRQKMGERMVAGLCARLSALNAVDSLAVGELRRIARQEKLGYLEPGAELSLADIAAYDGHITRWEKHQANRKGAA